MLTLLELLTRAEAARFEQVGRKDTLSDIYDYIATLPDINQLPRFRNIQNKAHDQDLLTPNATPQYVITCLAIERLSIDCVNQ